METKQTAVEWLFLKMNVIRLEHDMGMLDDFKFISSQNGVFKKAKQMEKEQIMDAYSCGEHQQGYQGEAENYYNEVHGETN